SASVSLDGWLEANRHRLTADAAMITDTGFHEGNIPAVTTSLRGMMYAQIDVRLTDRDLHSGSYGGAVANPAFALAQIITAMKGPDGRIRIPGFYDDVEPLSEAEQAASKRLADPEGFKRAAGVTGTPGEAGFSVLERIWGRPTLEVNGMWGGFTGEGTKTVIPSVAHAKITCRLVPSQDPDAIGRALEAKLRAAAPDYVELDFRIGDRSPAWSCSPEEPALAAAGAALGEAFGTPAIYARMGGSIGVVPTFARLLGAPIVMMGFALETENFHAPNEHFTLVNFDLGLRALVGYWLRLGGRVGAGDA
ncbi:MAG TPA: peptidase dimerization domain-containing protein, partial [Limnochordia bacterium]|nr:peptidase dimerization domain-containing protein [Limnochordia bacterium]